MAAVGEDATSHHPRPKHYCNVTFLSVGDVGPDENDGRPIERLLRCSRCQETYYCNRELQRRHWAIHKRVCKPPGADANPYRGSTATEVILQLLQLFNFNPHAPSGPNLIRNDYLGRALRFLLERLQVLCHCPDYEPTPEDLQHTEILYCNTIHFLKQSNEKIELLWAIPGMTTFFLNLELISEPMRRRKLNGISPTKEELDFQGFDPSYQNSHHFSTAIASFMHIFIERANTTGVCNNTAYRSTGFAFAAARRLMQWYADPYTRVSIPTSLGFCVPDGRIDINQSPRDFQFYYVLSKLLESLPDDTSDTKALVPGLTVQDVILILTEEPAWRKYVGPEQIAKCTRALIDSSSTKLVPWEALTVPSRASAAHMIVDRFIRNSEGLSWEVKHCGRLLLQIVMGQNSVAGIHDEILWLQVVKHAAKNRAAISFPGDDDDSGGPSRSTATGTHPDFFRQVYHRAQQAVRPALNALLQPWEQRGVSAAQLPAPSWSIFPSTPWTPRRCVTYKTKTMSSKKMQIGV